jgi:hypothetical protein
MSVVIPAHDGQDSIGTTVAEPSGTLRREQIGYELGKLLWSGAIMLAALPAHGRARRLRPRRDDLSGLERRASDR